MNLIDWKELPTIFTARTRSLRAGNVFRHVCQSDKLWVGGGGPM